MKLSAKPWAPSHQYQHSRRRFGVEMSPEQPSRLGCWVKLLTISANNSTRTQKVSFSTLKSVLGVPSLACGAPHTVTVPSLSRTRICPTKMRLSRPSMMLLEKRTMGCQVNEPAYVRRASSGSVKSAIGSRVAALRERVAHGTRKCSPVTTE